MKIGIDARMYGPQNSGLGRYIQQLITDLQETDSENEYVIFVKQDNFDTLKLSKPNFKKVLADIHWYGIEEQIKLTSLIEKENVDLTHFPHWNVPLNYRKPFNLTIHDLIMWHFPRREATTLNPLLYRIKNAAARFILKSAAKRAKHIFTTSEFTKKDIHEQLNVPLEKITVKYQKIHKAPAELPSEAEQEVFLQKHEIKKPFCLYVGNAYPHKNLERLVEAWSIFTQGSNSEHQLVLAGKESPAYENILNSELAKKLLQEKKLIYTGFVTDRELEILYSQTKLFIFPSIYEGYGLPPLEALSRGVPVISSHASCMPEVLEERVQYFDPKDTASMVSAIKNQLK